MSTSTPAPSRRPGLRERRRPREHGVVRVGDLPHRERRAVRRRRLDRHARRPRDRLPADRLRVPPPLRGTGPRSQRVAWRSMSRLSAGAPILRGPARPAGPPRARRRRASVPPPRAARARGARHRAECLHDELRRALRAGDPPPPPHEAVDEDHRVDDAAANDRPARLVVDHAVRSACDRIVSSNAARSRGGAGTSPRTIAARGTSSSSRPRRRAAARAAATRQRAAASRPAARSTRRGRRASSARSRQPAAHECASASSPTRTARRRSHVSAATNSALRPKPPRGPSTGA